MFFFFSSFEACRGLSTDSNRVGPNGYYFFFPSEAGCLPVVCFSPVLFLCPPCRGGSMRFAVPPPAHPLGVLPPPPSLFFFGCSEMTLWSLSGEPFVFSYPSGPCALARTPSLALRVSSLIFFISSRFDPPLPLDARMSPALLTLCFLLPFLRLSLFFWCNKSLTLPPSSFFFILSLLGNFGLLPFFPSFSYPPTSRSGRLLFSILFFDY